MCGRKCREVAKVHFAEFTGSVREEDPSFSLSSLEPIEASAQLKVSCSAEWMLSRKAQDRMDSKRTENKRQERVKNAIMSRHSLDREHFVNRESGCRMQKSTG